CFAARERTNQSQLHHKALPVTLSIPGGRPPETPRSWGDPSPQTPLAPLGSMIFVVTFFLCALGRPPPARRGDHPGREPPRGHEEPCMAHHTVLGADRQPFHVPAAGQALPGGRLVEAAVPAQRLHGTREL